MLLLLACTSPVVQTESRPSTAVDGESGSGTDSAPLEEIDGAIPAACPDLLDPEGPVLEAEVLIDPAEWSALQQDYRQGRKEYRPIRLRVQTGGADDPGGGVEEVEAWLRLKGNPSFSWFTEKMQFVVSFNESDGGSGDSGARFHGLRKLTFDAAWYEPTLLRERIAWSVMRRAGGLPGACVRSAALTINGEYYGAYASIEYFDHEWLERNFGDSQAGGGLWKYGQEVVANGEAANGGDITRLWSTTDPALLAEMGDATEWLRAWAAEAVLGDDDGFWCCAHNFYLYQHPERGVLFVPWDFDDILEVTPYDSDPVDGYPSGAYGLFQQPQFRAFVEDPVWRARYVEQVAIVNAAMDPAVVLPQIDAWQAEIRPYIADDPTRSFVVEEHDQTVERMRRFVEGRHAFLNSWVACAQGAETDADGDGYASCADRDDGRADIYPGAPEGCDGRDQDQDGVIDEGAGCDTCLYHGMDSEQFLFCREPLPFIEAEARCQAAGGHLGYPQTTGGIYLTWFHTWPVLEPWWLGATDAAAEGQWVDMAGAQVSGNWDGGEPDGGATENCAAWDEQSFAWTSEDCADANPFLCRR